MDSDELLKSALATYSDGEPPSGMEQRVMRRIANARARRVGAWLAVAIAASVALAVTGVRGPDRPAAHELPAPFVSRKAVPEPPPSIASSVYRVRAARRKAVHAFPSTPPLTNDERALLAFASSAPPEDVLSFFSPQEAVLKPIEIVPLEIEPLEVQ